MRFLLVELYIDMLKQAWVPWDEEGREAYEMMGKSVPPLGRAPSEVYQVFAELIMYRELARRRNQ